MRTATTIGFAVDKSDRPRLNRLAGIFGGGNRSEFLRKAMDVMEQLELVNQLVRVQAYGATRLSESRLTLADIPDLVARAIADPDPKALAEAKLIIGALPASSRSVDHGSSLSPVAEVFLELADRERGSSNPSPKRSLKVSGRKRGSLSASPKRSLELAGRKR
ncbi:MAG: hypothetical protein WC864_00300 [Ilumatobacteraceae bacterium]